MSTFFIRYFIAGGAVLLAVHLTSCATPKQELSAEEKFVQKTMEEILAE